VASSIGPTLGEAIEGYEAQIRGRNESKESSILTCVASLRTFFHGRTGEKILALTPADGRSSTTLGVLAAWPLIRTSICSARRRLSSGGR
jgi:hypothetical protein